MNPIPFYQRPLFIVSAALVLSALLNVGFLVYTGWQWGEKKVEAKLAAAESKLAAANTALAVTGVMAEKAEERRLEVLDELASIAERARETRVIYKNAAAAAPLDASCKPGIGRVQAVNANLGPGDKP